MLCYHHGKDNIFSYLANKILPHLPVLYFFSFPCGEIPIVNVNTEFLPFIRPLAVMVSYTGWEFPTGEKIKRPVAAGHRSF
jgi:hypothetical protein